MNKTLTKEMAVQALQTTQHDIAEIEASKMVKRFKQFRKQLNAAVRKPSSQVNVLPTFPDSLAYNAAALFRLMKTPGCIGIRCYPAFDEQQQFRLVMVGIDERGNNILPGILPGSTDGSLLTTKVLAETGSTGVLDEGQASPPYPAPENEL